MPTLRLSETGGLLSLKPDWSTQNSLLVGEVGWIKIGMPSSPLNFITRSLNTAKQNLQVLSMGPGKQ